MIVGMGDEGEVRRVFDMAAKLPSEDVRSDLTRWLLNNAREFAAGLAKERLPSWPRLARALFELGIVNRRGGPVSAGTLRAAWYRTRLFLVERGDGEFVGFSAAPKARNRKRLPARKARPVRVEHPLEPGEIAPGVRLVEPPAPVAARAAPVAGVMDEFDRLSRELDKRKGL